MREKGSEIAKEIVAEWNREKYFKKLAERMRKNKKKLKLKWRKQK